MAGMIEVSGGTALNFNQRWNSYLALAMVFGVLFVGLSLRAGNLNATQEFEDLEAGVRVQIPVGWLLDNDSPDYVFRAQDPAALPFKTTLQISVMTVGPDATPNTILDILYLQRAPRLSNYQELSRTDTTLRDDAAKRMTYAYTEFERNPFQSSVPLVIQGVDVVVLRPGEAVIITYREERTVFDTNLYRFENLLATVEIF
jgi:hypothetical protein